MNKFFLLILALALPAVAIETAKYKLAELEPVQGKFDPQVTQQTKYFEGITLMENKIFPGFAIRKVSVPFTPNIQLVNPEEYRKRVNGPSTNYYVNTCNCPYLKKYDLEAFHKKDALTPEEQHSTVVTYLLHFVRRALADLETNKWNFFLGTLKLASVSVTEVFGEVGGDSKPKDEHEFGLSLNFRFKTEPGTLVTAAGQTVKLSIHSRMLPVVDDDGDGNKFDLTAKMSVTDLANQEPQLREVVFVEGFRVKHNFLANACALARVLVSHTLKASLARVDPVFKSCNFCSHRDFLAEVLPKVGDAKDPKAINDAFDFGPWLKGDGAQNLEKSDGYWTAIKEYPLKDWVSETYTWTVAFPNQLLEDFQIETTPLTGNEPHQPRIGTMLEALNEAYYSEHQQRFSVLKSKNERKGSPEIPKVVELLEAQGPGGICKKFRGLLDLSICPFGSDKLCQDLAYLRTINNLRFACEEGSDCDSPMDSQFQIWTIFDEQVVGWAKFGASDDKAADLCVEFETNYLTLTDNKLHCWKDIKDQSTNPAYFTDFMGLFLDRVRLLEQKLLSRVTKMEVMEFTLMLFEDYEQSRDRYEKGEPHPKVRDQLRDLWKNHKVRSDLDFQLSHSSISVRTHLVSHPEVFFDIRVLDKKDEFIKLVLTNPSKLEEVFINKDIGAEMLIPLYHLGGLAAKEEKFGRLFAHFGLQIMNFVNSILPPVAIAGEKEPEDKKIKVKNESCFKYFEANFQSDNLQFSTFMAFVQLAMESHGYLRILDRDPAQFENKNLVFGKDEACMADKKFGVVKPGFPPILPPSAPVMAEILDIFPEERDPLEQYLYYTKKEDADEDAKYLDFEPEFDEAKAYPEPTVLVKDVLDYSINHEFKVDTTSVTMTFGHPTLKRRLQISAHIYSYGTMRSVHLAFDSGYFDHESILMLTVFRETRDHVFDATQAFLNRLDEMVKNSKTSDVRQGYTADNVKAIIDGLIASQSTRTFCVTKVGQSYTYSIIPPGQPEKVEEQRLARKLGLMTRSSLDGRRLGTVLPECGDNIIMPNIEVKYLAEDKKEIVVSIMRNEKVVNGEEVKLPFSESYTIQKLYPFNHKAMLVAHLTGLIKKLE